MRKLFVAKDPEGKKIHIDDISGPDANKKYSCPYCSREVIPRLGEQKEKHFAHKDGFCGVELNSENKDKNQKEIKLNTFETNDESPFENKQITPKTLVRCRICGDNLRFENAILVKENPVDGNIYICKNCKPRIKEIAREF